MSRLREYSLVRVVKLRAAPDEYDGWKVNTRAPRVGDLGTLVDILHAAGVPDRYVVECASDTGDGSDEWLGDFAEDELEPQRSSSGASKESTKRPSQLSFPEWTAQTAAALADAHRRQRLRLVLRQALVEASSVSEARSMEPCTDVDRLQASASRSLWLARSSPGCHATTLTGRKPPRSRACIHTTTPFSSR